MVQLVPSKKAYIGARQATTHSRKMYLATICSPWLIQDVLTHLVEYTKQTIGVIGEKLKLPRPKHCLRSELYNQCINILVSDDWDKTTIVPVNVYYWNCLSTRSGWGCGKNVGFVGGARHGTKVAGGDIAVLGPRRPARRNCACCTGCTPQRNTYEIGNVIGSMNLEIRPIVAC